MVLNLVVFAGGLGPLLLFRFCFISYVETHKWKWYFFTMLFTAFILYCFIPNKLLISHFKSLFVKVRQGHCCWNLWDSAIKLCNFTKKPEKVAIFKPWCDAEWSQSPVWVSRRTLKPAILAGFVTTGLQPHQYQSNVEKAINNVTIDLWYHKGVHVCVIYWT